MSKRWPGGIVTKTQATPTGPYENSSAPGIWTLNQMSYWVKQALWPTAGNVNPNFFIENLFSTYLYTGNGTSQTITNGINLSGQGGLTWIKSRSDATENLLYDTSRGAFNYLISSSTGAQSNGSPTGLSAFNTTGFNVAGTTIGGGVNGSGATYVSWTFRKQPKFFDVVTWTGDLSGNRTLNHNLASTPGCIIVKATNAADDWYVYHTSLGTSKFIYLNTTGASTSASVVTAVTDTTFTVSQSNGFNTSGRTYVAYLFAHNAGGFGLSGTENVISCGSWTNDSGGYSPFISLGYEPQWILFKRTDSATGGNWNIIDNMRDLTAYTTQAAMPADRTLFPNLSNAETQSAVGQITPTGFYSGGTANATYIYIAIRRGPMQVPTIGTSVFSPVAYTGTGTNDRQIGASTFVNDFILGTKRNTIDGKYFYTRLQGNGTYLNSTSTSAEGGVGDTTYGPQYNKIQFGYQQGSGDAYNLNNSGDTFINYLFRRAPGFFDVVCYTGTGVATTVAHNLGVAPELMIVKSRSAASQWPVFSKTVFDISSSGRLRLNETDGYTNSLAYFNATAPTSSVFTVGTSSDTNGSSATYVAYLFATVAGVSKVGSYTGTGATLNINAGFTTGARFVMIKRTDSTGSWFVWDTARGMVSGTDPRLALNSTAAESNADWVYTATSGFQIVTTDATVNASGGSYIYLAVA